MKAIILEDESRAVNHLLRLIGRVAPHIDVCASFETVREAIVYLEKDPQPELIFSDVQLADGNSFEVFSRVSVDCPIIFTTAYDTYAIEAFNANGIDYLLKPIEEERLAKAIEKAVKYSSNNKLESSLDMYPLSAYRLPNICFKKLSSFKGVLSSTLAWVIIKSSSSPLSFTMIWSLKP